MKRFKSSRLAGKFPSIHDLIANLVHHPNPERQFSSIRRARRSGAFAAPREITEADLAA